MSNKEGESQSEVRFFHNRRLYSISRKKGSQDISESQILGLSGSSGEIINGGQLHGTRHNGKMLIVLEKSENFQIPHAKRAESLEFHPSSNPTEEKDEKALKYEIQLKNRINTFFSRSSKRRKQIVSNIDDNFVNTESQRSTCQDTLNQFDQQTAPSSLSAEQINEKMQSTLQGEIKFNLSSDQFSVQQSELFGHQIEFESFRQNKPFSMVENVELKKQQQLPIIEANKNKGEEEQIEQKDLRLAVQPIVSEKQILECSNQQNQENVVIGNIDCLPRGIIECDSQAVRIQIKKQQKQEQQLLEQSNKTSKQTKINYSHYEDNGANAKKNTQPSSGESNNNSQELDGIFLSLKQNLNEFNQLGRMKKMEEEQEEGNEYPEMIDMNENNYRSSSTPIYFEKQCEEDNKNNVITSKGTNQLLQQDKQLVLCCDNDSKRLSNEQISSKLPQLQQKLNDQYISQSLNLEQINVQLTSEQQLKCQTGMFINEIIFNRNVELVDYQGFWAVFELEYDSNAKKPTCFSYLLSLLPRNLSKQQLKHKQILLKLSDQQINMSDNRHRMLIKAVKEGYTKLMIGGSGQQQQQQQQQNYQDDKLQANSNNINNMQQISNRRFEQMLEKNVNDIQIFALLQILNFFQCIKRKSYTTQHKRLFKKISLILFMVRVSHIVSQKFKDGCLDAILKQQQSQKQKGQQINVSQLSNIIFQSIFFLAVQSIINEQLEINELNIKLYSNLQDICLSLSNTTYIKQLIEQYQLQNK